MVLSIEERVSVSTQRFSERTVLLSSFSGRGLKQARLTRYGVSFTATGGRIKIG
jgi:hypothetical protein